MMELDEERCAADDRRKTKHQEAHAHELKAAEQRLSASPSPSVGLSERPKTQIAHRFKGRAREDCERPYEKREEPNDE